ncbi:MAG TPA: riboflavin synthase [Planctomycetota bacterium]|nr:riboflavin synthase [Planctomycetota bacterium]
MFTGLVEDSRPVRASQPRRDGGRDLTVDLGDLAEGVRVGDSIAISGVCLTVARLDGPAAVFELSPETLARTRLGAVVAGDHLNVERALRAGDRLGGHIVQGHVDGLATVRRLDRSGEWVELDVEVDAALSRYVVEKGSITLDGVSLTAARVKDALVTIALVPLTLEKTTLGSTNAGDRLHVEVDVIAKYVERLAGPHTAGR